MSWKLLASAFRQTTMATITSSLRRLTILLSSLRRPSDQSSAKSSNIVENSTSRSWFHGNEKTSSQQAPRKLSSLFLRNSQSSLPPSEPSDEPNNIAENASSSRSRNICIRKIIRKGKKDDIGKHESKGSRTPSPFLMHEDYFEHFLVSSKLGNDERLIYQAILEDLNQSKAEGFDLPEGLLSVPLLKHQKIGLAWMLRREARSSYCLGGILADQQGLGKTVSVIALIVMQKFLKSQSSEEQHNHKAEAINFDDDDDDGTSVEWGPSVGTLIVCPATLLRQWARELDEKVAAKAKLSVLVHHGSTRMKTPDKFANYDVVLTTNATVKNEVPNGPLAMVNWHRVVLDEAHLIRNDETKVSRACSKLHAERRWCLSGTPIQNSIDDLYSYFRFLRFHPYSEHKWFSSAIKAHISRSSLLGNQKLQAVLSRIMLRRTKETLIDGQRILELPKKSIDLIEVEFSPEEEDFYDSLESGFRAKFKGYFDAGTVKRHWDDVLLMILRLRQACDHRDLVTGCNSYSVSAKIRALEEILLSNCKAKNPFSGLNGSTESNGTTTEYSSTPAEGPIKTIVFSQWHGMLDKVEESLKQHGIQYRRFDGKMNLHERDKALERFKTDPEVNVMLMSTMAGNIGLNITAASLVIIMDPWWNPSIEDQAIDRVHRIGQTCPVTIKRIIIKGTIEERMLVIQEEKRQIAASAFREDVNDDLATSLTVEDMKYLFRV